MAGTSPETKPQMGVAGKAEKTCGNFGAETCNLLVPLKFPKDPFVPRDSIQLFKGLTWNPKINMEPANGGLVQMFFRNLTGYLMYFCGDEALPNNIGITLP